MLPSNNQTANSIAKIPNPTTQQLSHLPSQGDFFTFAVTSIAAAVLTPDRVTQFCGHLIGATGKLFSYLKGESGQKQEDVLKPSTVSSSLSCALGVAGLASMQPMVQGVSLPLLADCFQAPGVQAAPSNRSFMTQGFQSGNFTPVCLTITQSGEYVVTGHVKSPLSSGNQDHFVTKFSNEGKELWTLILNGPGEEHATSVIAASSGEYIFSGFSLQTGVLTMIQSRVSSDGNTVSSKKLERSSGALMSWISLPTASNEVVHTGYISNPGLTRHALLLQKNGEDGTPIWTKGFDPGIDSNGRFITQAQDGGYLISGNMFNSGSGKRDFSIQKFSSNGDFLWGKTLTRTNHTFGEWVSEAPNGDVFVGGFNRELLDSEDFGGIITKFSSNGDFLWAVSLWGDEKSAIRKSIVTPSGDLLITGDTSAYGSKKAFVAKIDSNGNPIWAQKLEGVTGSWIEKTKDDGFVITGPQTNPQTQETGLFLAKFDENGRIANCKGAKFFEMPVQNITQNVSVNGFSVSNFTATLTMNPWSPPSIKTSLNHVDVCPGNSTTQTESLTGQATPTFSGERSPSNTTSLSSEISGSKDRSKTETDLKSLSKELSETESSLRTLSRESSSTFTKTGLKTVTKQLTETDPLDLSTATLIEQSNVPSSGVLKLQLSSSGTVLLANRAKGVKLVTIDPSGLMTETGEIETNGTPKGSSFSVDERYLFIAEQNGRIRINDIQNPRSPLEKGSFQVLGSISSIATSGSGEELLVGTETGIEVFSIKDLANINSILPLASFKTASPVSALKTNPRTNLVAVGTGRNLLLLEYTDQQWKKIDEQVFPSNIREIEPFDQVNPTQLTLSMDSYQNAFVNITAPEEITVTSLQQGSQNEHIARSGSTLLVAGVKEGVQILKNEQNNWDTTREIGYSPVTKQVRDLLFSSDGRFSVYSDSEGIKLIKIVENPGRLDVPLPRLEDTLDFGFQVNQVLLNEQRNWIAAGGEKLLFFANDNLKNPKILGDFTPPAPILEMKFFPDKANMLVLDRNGIGCINCFNPEAPFAQSRWESENPIQSFTLAGSHAYVSQGGHGVTVLDVSDKSNIVQAAHIPTEGAAQAIRFNKDRTLAYVGDSKGIDIYSVVDPLNLQHISRLNSTGFITNIELTSDEKTLYFSSGRVLGQVNVTRPEAPELNGRIETTYPIEDITISNQGSAAYIGVEIDGMFVLDTKTLELKGNLPGTQVKQVVLDTKENRAYIPNGNRGVKVASLIKELPVIPLSSRNRFPVGIPIEETLSFYDRSLNPIEVDKINKIDYINRGVRQELPLWISVDLIQKKLFINPPKELTNQPIQLAISFDLDGVRQETIYQATVVSSLEIDTQKNSLAIKTPSPTATVGINLVDGSFIPEETNSLLVSSEKNSLRVSGTVDLINPYLQRLRINPDPITKNASEVALSLAQVTAEDIVNLFPTNRTIALRSFRFNQAPKVLNPMKKRDEKALQSFEIKVPETTFQDPDDINLSFSAKLLNGSSLPSWLSFNQEMGTFEGTPPASMLNQTLQIQLTASDGYLSSSTPWELHIDGNRGPFVAKPYKNQEHKTGDDFTFVLPSNLFGHLDNESLQIQAVEKDKESLPNFLQFNSESLTFRGGPSSNNRGSYPIQLTATDKFGASAVLVFDLDISFSFWDGFDYYGLRYGPVGFTLATAGAAFKYRHHLKNTFNKNRYWRDQPPRELLEGQEYKPKKPKGENQSIPKNEIDKVHLLYVDQEKFAHECAKKTVPFYLYASKFARPLTNGEPFPHWIEHNEAKGTIRVKGKPPHDEKRIFLYEVIGKNKEILESFFIDPEKISLYEAPSNSQRSSITNPSTQQANSTNNPNLVDLTDHDDIISLGGLWNGVDDEQEMTEVNTDKPRDAKDTFEEDFLQQEPVVTAVETISRQSPEVPPSPIAIDIDALDSSSEREDKGMTQGIMSGSWKKPEQTVELEDMLGGKNREESSKYEAL